MEMIFVVMLGLGFAIGYLVGTTRCIPWSGPEGEG